jgi:hypothetical protein
MLRVRERRRFAAISARFGIDLPEKCRPRSSKDEGGKTPTNL